MAQATLPTALDLMRQHYGRPPVPGLPGRWETLVRVVLTAGLSPAQQARISWGDLPVGAPGAVAERGGESLAEHLAPVPRGRQKVAVLKTLADWWRRRFGNEAEAEWGGDTETLHAELQRLRGVSLELADRLLLFVGARPAFPLDRAAVRITCRHGWCGLEAEYDEWQALFVRGLDATAELQAFALLASRVGKDFCGTVPKCEACPLKPLLPPGGPCEPGDVTG